MYTKKLYLVLKENIGFLLNSCLLLSVPMYARIFSSQKSDKFDMPLLEVGNNVHGTNNCGKDKKSHFSFAICCRFPRCYPKTKSTTILRGKVQAKKRARLCCEERDRRMNARQKKRKQKKLFLCFQSALRVAREMVVVSVLVVCLYPSLPFPKID